MNLQNPSDYGYNRAQTIIYISPKLLFFWEFFGTSLFIFGVLTSQDQDLQISLSFFAARYFVFPFTGGHLNPIITLTMFLIEKTRKDQVLVYFSAQCLGSITGNVLAYLIPSKYPYPFELYNSSFSYNAMDFFNEIFAAFLFMIILLILTQRETQLVDVPLLRALSISSCLYFSRILSLPSGGILNPAAIVSFELFNFDSEHIRKILVFASAEFLGAIIAAGIFKGIYLPQALKLKHTTTKIELKEATYNIERL